MDKVQKIRKKVEKLMYGFNLEADIASCENAETEKIADIKYQLCKKILEYIDSLQEEHVDGDLEKAANDYGIRQGAELKPFAIKFFKAGANWQKEQDQSTIELAEDHAMFAGMEKMKEQMMAKAIDAHCFGFQGAALFTFRLPADNYLVGSKVKVIVIKED